MLHNQSTFSTFKTFFACLAFVFCTQNMLLAQISIELTTHDASCAEICDGSIDVEINGGISPYSILWSTGGSTAIELCGDPSGLSYAVTVTDANGVTTSATASIFSPMQLSVTAFGNSQICDAAPDGQATAIPYGGTAPYTYLWSTGETSPQIENLEQGSYTVTTSDAHGCTAISAALVEFWDEGLWLMDMTTNITCSSNGSIAVSAMSGTAPYIYEWNTGATSFEITDLTPGIYTVTVTDANGCNNSLSLNLTAPNTNTWEVVANVLQVACAPNTGVITATNLYNGYPPYTYLWNTGSTEQTITNLSAGTFSVTVTDSNDCTQTSMVGLVNATPPTVSAIITEPDCGLNNGSISVEAEGGLTPYFYVWNVGTLGSMLSNIGIGIYSVETIDALGCSVQSSFTLDCIPTNATKQQFQIGNIQLSPNPANDFFVIPSAYQNKIQQITIFDSQGRKCLERPAFSEKIDISELASGHYVVQFQMGKGIGFGRLMVVRHP